MYTYKFVSIKHSMWTGKPNSKIEEVVEEYAADGWKLVQVLQDHAAIWYKGRMHTKIIFEKRVTSDFYDQTDTRGYIENEFV